ncbi:hypothetical protein KKH56_02905 [bacterium]|nr:hypothetical protein [bacterium]
MALSENQKDRIKSLLSEKIEKKLKSNVWRIPTEDYETRLQALFRNAGDDVTSQVISAYQEKIRDKIKEYLPNKKELIEAASQFFIQSIKTLGQSGS